MLQANFDAALEARHAMAQGRLWAGGNLALAYGNLHNGGDSPAIQRDLNDRLLQKGKPVWRE